MATWKELRRYCNADGWELYKDTDHYFYRKILPDGTVLLTKSSKGSGEIPKGLWRRILKQQLQTTQEDFNKKI
ncbi:type II toxin-antitoxin system HicA family toxin [Baia soyae]|uniref:type II toxin-antitoxin system HicA family toxin n=1 Tax=Baia soyae TaxID=1544746 RepID=UPI00104B08F8|nr:type II toxin-antitoxin system HicA family toxin [Baia soyae]